MQIKKVSYATKQMPFETCRVPRLSFLFVWWHLWGSGGSLTDTALYELPTPAFKAMNKYINKKTNYLGIVTIQRVFMWSDF